MAQKRAAPSSLTSENLSQIRSQRRRIEMAEERAQQEEQKDIPLPPAIPKLIQDPIHGPISIHPVAAVIINTPQVERLHHVCQLSAMRYVYPSATYSRFEHSIGVYHLAGKLVNMFKENQPELGISRRDALCVQLAGLTHDLGHGPFSHIFDKEVVPKLQEETGEKWKHEQASADMLQHIYSKQEVKECFDEWTLDEKDVEFIKSLILNRPQEETTGRGKNKDFLYEIVANGRNGIDVDKWDYLTRDSHRLGIKCGFDYTRLLYHMRVIKVDGVPQICVRDKEDDTIYSMFHTRFDLYKKAYQHRGVLVANLMIAEALVKAAPYLKFSGKTMLECLDDMEAYTGLHDGVFYKILDSEEPELEDSRELLKRLQTRKLWKFVCQAKVSLKIEEAGWKRIQDEISGELGNISQNIKLHICARTFGETGRDPLENLRVYSKREHNKARELTDKEKSAILPKKYRQIWLRAYYTGDEGHIPPGVKAAVEEQFGAQNLTFIDY